MTVSRGILAVLIVFGLGMASVPARAEAVLPTELHLVMSMAGVTAGAMTLSIDPEGEEVASSLRMKSQGMFKFITGYKSRSRARSFLAPDGVAPMPVRFDSTYETNNTDRKVEILYDRNDGRITDLETWKRGKPRKIKVPEDLRLNTIDPLTAMLQLRHWIREIRAERGARGGLDGSAVSSPRQFEVFDGRRRYRIDVELQDRRRIEIDGKARPAFRFKVQLKPLAGFSSKDMLANWSSEDGQRWIELVVTDEDNPIPYTMTTKGGSLATTIYLRKICIGDQRCTKVSG